MNIEIMDLSKSYFLAGTEIRVLKNIFLNIKSGDAISLTGPSGVGKSTLLHLIGLLDEPTSGFVVYNNLNFAALNDARAAHFRNSFIGFVFQFHHLLSEFSALENVMMPLLIRRLPKMEASDRAQQILQFVGLSKRLSHKPGELSGGEQQRVALARALVTEPSVLLADEPTGNLDETTGREIVDLILEHNQKNNVTVMLVTHNPKISDLFTRRLMLTKEGLQEAEH